MHVQRFGAVEDVNTIHFHLLSLQSNAGFVPVYCVMIVFSGLNRSETIVCKKILSPDSGSDPNR